MFETNLTPFNNIPLNTHSLLLKSVRPRLFPEYATK